MELIRIRRIFKHFLGSRRGSVSTTIAVTSPLILAALGLGIDASMNYLTSERMQGAADLAAQGAARARLVDEKSDSQSEAEFIASAAGFSPETGATITANYPPKSGSFTGSTSHIEVLISEPERRYFSALFGDKPVTVTARAVASFSKGSATCMMALNKTASKAVNVSGGATVNLENCDMQVNSSSTTALTASGGALVDADNVMIVGGAGLSGGAKVATTGSYLLKAPYVDDPLAFKVQPTASSKCTMTGFATSSPATLSPGTYCGGITVKSGGNVYLNPGVYVINNGGLTVSGGGILVGSGVTIFMTSTTGSAYGKVVFSGSSIVELTAPTSGSTAGIALFGDRKAPVGTKYDFSGGANMKIDGFIYAPSAFINWSGGSTVSTYCTTVIGDTIQFSGDAGFTTSDCDKYGLFAGGSAITLVE